MVCKSIKIRYIWQNLHVFLIWHYFFHENVSIKYLISSFKNIFIGVIESLISCVNNDKFKIPKTINELKSFFRVVYNDNLILYTIKNYNKRSLEKLINKNNIILQQKSRTTVQLIAQV